MRFSDSFLDEIRDRVPISSGGRHARLVGQEEDQCAARRLLGLLPVPWREVAESFHCEDKKGRYHCFGCGVSGDHFRFLTELDGLSFPEAVERIAEHGRRADAGARRARPSSARRSAPA